MCGNAFHALNYFRNKLSKNWIGKLFFISFIIIIYWDNFAFYPQAELHSHNNDRIKFSIIKILTFCFAEFILSHYFIEIFRNWTLSIVSSYKKTMTKLSKLTLTRTERLLFILRHYKLNVVMNTRTWIIFYCSNQLLITKIFLTIKSLPLKDT